MAPYGASSVPAEDVVWLPPAARKRTALIYCPEMREPLPKHQSKQQRRLGGGGGGGGAGELTGCHNESTDVIDSFYGFKHNQIMVCVRARERREEVKCAFKTAPPFFLSASIYDFRSLRLNLYHAGHMTLFLGLFVFFLFNMEINSHS